MIYTLTLNPALDQELTVPDLLFDEVLRATANRIDYLAVRTVAGDDWLAPTRVDRQTALYYFLGLTNEDWHLLLE